MAWAYEDVNVDGLGTVRLTGDLSRVMAAVPEGTSLHWHGKPFRCHASWLLQGEALGQPDAWMLGKGRESGLDDGEAAEVRDLLEDAVAEWVADPEAHAMLAANASQARLGEEEATTLRARMRSLQESADGTDPYATMDALREAAEIAVRLRAAGGTA